MGVHGLVPFLQKVRPDVIKTLPNRLRALRGKKIVMDGTLLTQRLHFAPMPHKYRHVLGWYRIVKELHESGVQAVCVFDGPERSLAKQIEVDRRRRVRRVTAARSVFEAERFKRLQGLELLSGQWSELEPFAREEVLDVIHALLSDWQPAKPATKHSPLIAPGSLQALDDPTEPRPLDFVDPAATAGFPTGSSLGMPSLTGSLDDVRSTSFGLDDPLFDPSYHNPTLDSVYGCLPPLDQLPPDDRELTRLDQFIDKFAAIEQRSTHGWPQLKESFTSTLMSQYIRFQQSIPRLESLPVPSASEVTIEESSDEYVMSKNQQQLTMDECRFWEDLSRCTTASEAQSVMRTGIDTLTQRSSLLSQSYLRRTNPPSLKTYKESKEILCALGIPCVETSGPYEAEALASSLVLSGYADYVASEDSDVIVYEAPLIRNLSSRRDPLVIISGAEVRLGLELDRASFVDFALLLGTDFSQRIKNVGPQRALKFIREHRSIERILEKERQYPPRGSPEVYLSQVTRARMVFGTLPPAPDIGLLEPDEIDEDAVNTILRRYNLQDEISDRWEFRQALAGNYFHDNPSAS